MHRLKRLSHPDIWIGAGILFLLSLPFIFSNLDLTLASWFYREGWFLGNSQPWRLLFHFGTLPGLLLSIAGLVILIGSLIWARLQNWRQPAALLVLTLLIGPGLFINVLGKGYWGRPRPRDVIEFKGNEKFQRFIKPGIPGQGKSFPCGHASVGFILAALYFVEHSRRRRAAWLGIGLSYGTLMGIGRMAQGAHFASDVLWSGGLTYLSAAFLHHVILPSGKKNPPQDRISSPSLWRKGLAWVLLGVTVVFATAFFLLATPYHKKWFAQETGSPNLTAVRLKLPVNREEIRIIHAKQIPALRVHAKLRGFGFPKLRLQGLLSTETTGTTLTASLQLSFNRWITERKGEITFILREDLSLLLDSENADMNILIGDLSVPSRIGALRVNSRRGGIRFHLSPGSWVTGPVELITQEGDLRATLLELEDPGPSPWELGTSKGIFLLEIRQTRRPIQKLKLRGWCRWKNIAFQAKISPACGLHLEWDEGDGRSALKAKGAWKQIGNHVYGPAGIPTPNFDIFLATSQGRLAMELLQLKGPAVTPLFLPMPATDPTPTAWEDDLPDSKVNKEEPAPVPEWIRKEALDLKQDKSPSPHGPFVLTPTSGK